MPTDRDVQEAHLPVELIYEDVSHVADHVIVGVGNGAMDHVARHEKDICPPTRFFHGKPPPYARFTQRICYPILGTKTPPKPVCRDPVPASISLALWEARTARDFGKLRR